MIKQIICCISTLIYFGNIYGDDKDDNVSFSMFSFEFYNNTNIGLNILSTGRYYFNNRLEIEYPPALTFNITIVDKYNNNKKNLSLSTLYSFLLSQTTFEWEDNILGKILLPLSLAMSTYRFTPKGSGNIFNVQDSAGLSVTGSFYVRNNLDINIFHRVKWFSLYPGCGISVKISSSNGFEFKELTATTGVSYTNNFILLQDTDRYLSVYLKFAFTGLI